MATISSALSVVILSLAMSYAAPTTDDVPLVVFPPECEGQRFCTIKPEGYDLLEDRMNSLLPEYLIQDYADRLGEANSKPNPLDDKGDKDKHNCRTITGSFSPSSIKELNKENQTKTELVIQTKIFKQNVTTVDCDYESIAKEIDEYKPQCFQDVISSPDFDLTSACKRTLGYQTLYIYDIDKHEILNITISIPVACSCQTYHI